MTKEERLELNSICLKIFGRSSVWRKFMDKGELTTLIRKLDDGTEESYRGYKYPTLEEVKNRLAQLLKEKEENEAKQKAKEVVQGTEETGTGTKD